MKSKDKITTSKAGKRRAKALKAATSLTEYIETLVEYLGVPLKTITLEHEAPGGGIEYKKVDYLPSAITHEFLQPHQLPQELRLAYVDLYNKIDKLVSKRLVVDGRYVIECTVKDAYLHDRPALLTGLTVCAVDAVSELEGFIENPELASLSKFQKP